MNKKLLNTQIEALTEKHAKKIVKFYKKHGFDTSDCQRYLCNDDSFRFYGVGGTLNIFTNRCNIGNDTIKTITLKQAKALVKENEYPKVMWVSDSKYFKLTRKRVVFMEQNGKFLAWAVETIEESMHEETPVLWKYAKDINEPNQKIQISKSDFKEKFGVDLSKYEIVE